MLGADSFDYVTYAVVDGEFPESIEDCDGWIITGSKHGAYEDHDWIPPLEAFIRALAKSNRPTVGICFGHQIMAQALGGEVVKSDKGWGVGFHEYENLETGKRAKLLAFHQDQVIKLPNGATVTHRSDFCPFAGIRYSESCQSLQPHPEHGPGFTEALLKERRGKAIEESVADIALEGLQQDNSHAEYASSLKAFFEKM
nr:type 1 glutamine amidotransferase [Sneathiella limimaris]